MGDLGTKKNVLAFMKNRFTIMSEAQLMLQVTGRLMAHVPAYYTF